MSLRRLTNVKKIVFASGGCNGAAYVGCLDAIERIIESNYGPSAVTDFYDRLEECAGTSAGAFMAFAVCGGWRAKQLRRLLESLDVSMLSARMDPSRLLNECGLHDGSGPLRMMLQALLHMARLSPYTTFAEFHRHCGGRRLTVHATRLQDGTKVEFNHETTPGVFVVDAILASATVPFVFKPARIDGELYVDGALSNPYPLKADEPATTMGFCVSEDGPSGDGPDASASLRTYALQIVGIVGRHVDHLKHEALTPAQREATTRVRIPRGIKWFDFSSFNPARLVSVGRRAMLARHEPGAVLALASLALFMERHREIESLPPNIFGQL